jgi:hypothetical protein
MGNCLVYSVYFGFFRYVSSRSSVLEYVIGHTKTLTMKPQRQSICSSTVHLHRYLTSIDLYGLT